MARVTEAGADRQWPGEVVRARAGSGHSPQGGFPASGQQLPCCVAAAQVTAGAARLNSAKQATRRLVRRRDFNPGSGSQTCHQTAEFGQMFTDFANPGQMYLNWFTNRTAFDRGIAEVGYAVTRM
jgi:hypothetical protein